MSKNFNNEFEISKITLFKKVHCYCRLGNDWYTNQLKIEFNPNELIPDYVYIDNQIESQCEKQDLLIEEIIYKIKNIILDCCPCASNIKIQSYIDDSVPKNMQVLVEL